MTTWAAISRSTMVQIPVADEVGTEVAGARTTGAEDEVLTTATTRALPRSSMDRHRAGFLLLARLALGMAHLHLQEHLDLAWGCPLHRQRITVVAVLMIIMEEDTKDTRVASGMVLPG